MEPELWKQLPDKVKNMVLEIRKEGMKNAGISSPFSGKPNSTNTEAPPKLAQSDSILKNPTKQESTTNTKTPQKLPNQYSNNNAIANNILTGNNSVNFANANVNTTTADSGEDNISTMDNKQVFANMVNWYNENSKPSYHINNLNCKVSKHITVLLSKLNKGFNIVDSGADTRVVGNTWKPLDIIDYNTPRANVIGFATNVSCKKELPIGTYVTKTTTSTGKEIILRALHAVGNDSSSHTLLCTYQMREIGLIVDDVSKHHVANKSGITGTQSIVFQDGTTVALKCKHTLMSFTTTIPTEYELHH